MAQILRQNITGDGYDVIVEVAGQSHVLHFLGQPSEAELAERIDQFERRVLDEIVVAKALDQEEEDD